MLKHEIAERILRQAEFYLNCEMQDIIRDHGLRREPVKTEGRMWVEVVDVSEVSDPPIDIRVSVCFRVDHGRVMTVAERIVPRFTRMNTLDELLMPDLAHFAARLMDGLYAS